MTATNARSLVPEGQIRWLVDRMHVGVSEDTVRADIEARAAIVGGTMPRYVKACGDYAVRCHRSNRGLYVRVTAGRL